MLKNLYFLGIIPPDEIAAEITQMKQFCAEKFQTVHALNSPPHITIVPPFKTDLTGEKIMLDQLPTLTKALKPLYIELKGFHHFSNRVVFVSVEPNPSLNSIHNRFLPVISQMLAVEIPKEVKFHAHMTIAFKDVSPKQFEGIWDHYKDQNFNRIFLCSGITLLKYVSHGWSPVKIFSFG